MFIFGLSCCFRSLSIVALCDKNTPPTFILLQRRSTYIPPSSGILRRSDRYEVFRGFYQVCSMSFLPEIASLMTFSCDKSYLIIIKGLMPNVVASLYHDLTSPTTNPPEWALSGRNWISILMIILVPLVFLRRLDSLRHTSYIALFSVGQCVPFSQKRRC